MKNETLNIAITMIQQAIKNSQLFDETALRNSIAQSMNEIGILTKESFVKILELTKNLLSMTDQEREKVCEKILLVIESELLEEAEDYVGKFAQELAEAAAARWNEALESKQEEIEQLKDNGIY